MFWAVLLFLFLLFLLLLLAIFLIFVSLLFLMLLFVRFATRAGSTLSHDANSRASHSSSGFLRRYFTTLFVLFVFLLLFLWSQRRSVVFLR